MMNLDFRLDEKVGRLSVANQQLIEIARCLVSNPRVLILDERPRRSPWWRRNPRLNA